jgi:hypothetical protein
MGKLILGLILALSLGCATAIRGVEEVFVVESNPVGAKVTLVYDSPQVLYTEEAKDSNEWSDAGGDMGVEVAERRNTITIERLEGVTPATFKIPRKGAFTVRITKEGYNPVVTRVETQVASGGGAAMAGSICLGGCLGGVVDASSGATLEHVPGAIKVTLEKEGCYREPNPTHEPPSKRGDPVEQNNI